MLDSGSVCRTCKQTLLHTWTCCMRYYHRTAPPLNTLPQHHHRRHFFLASWMDGVLPVPRTTYRCYRWRARPACSTCPSAPLSTLLACELRRAGPCRTPPAFTTALLRYTYLYSLLRPSSRTSRCHLPHLPPPATHIYRLPTTFRILCHWATVIFYLSTSPVSKTGWR